MRLNTARTAALSDEVWLETASPVALAWGPNGLYYSTPDSIRVVPIAAPRRDDRRKTVTAPSPRSDTGPEPAAAPDAASDRRRWIVVLLVGVALGAAYALARTRMSRSR